MWDSLRVCPDTTLAIERDIKPKLWFYIQYDTGYREMSVNTKILYSQISVWNHNVPIQGIVWFTIEPLLIEHCWIESTETEVNIGSLEGKFYCNYLCQGGTKFMTACLIVCLFVSRITLLVRSSWKQTEKIGLATT